MKVKCDGCKKEFDQNELTEFKGENLCKKCHDSALKTWGDVLTRGY